MIRPVSGRNPCDGSSVVMRHWRAAPRSWIRSCVRPSSARRLPGGDAHLRLHEVDIRHLLGDGVLDLDARVHLDEDDLAGAGARRLEEELHRAGVLVADRPRERDGVAVERVPDGRGRGSARARSRSPSGDGAAPSSRARTGARSRPSRRRGSAPRRGAAAARPARGTRGRRRRRSPPRASPRPARARALHGVSTRRIPRPPPPATAFTKMGKPMSSACRAGRRRRRMPRSSAAPARRRRPRGASR